MWPLDNFPIYLELYQLLKLSKELSHNQRKTGLIAPQR